MQSADNPKPIARAGLDQLMRYREKLLAAGFHEPTKWQSSSWHWLFYKPLTSLTAFVVNLQGHDDRVEVTYGCASTAFTRFAGDENALIEHGVSDGHINLRERVIIRNSADEAAAQACIQDMHARYLLTEKDELLAHAKAKQKDFIQQISLRLKPLGFRKKGNRWSRPLEGCYYTTFNAQKSAYEDAYYFNVYIGKEGTNRYGDCCYVRIAPLGLYPADWQTLAPAALVEFLDGTLVPAMTHIVQTPLTVLGAEPNLWAHCGCQRTCCESCWVHKNMWEAREST